MPGRYVLGPNVRLFQQYGVTGASMLMHALCSRWTGVFEEGDYTSLGGDMEALKTYVLSQLLWDPARDDRALIAAFVTTYYGNAAIYIQSYLDIMAESVQARGRHALMMQYDATTGCGVVHDVLRPVDGALSVQQHSAGCGNPVPNRKNRSLWS